jgi:alpha-tubulin suppressor-like RCC1 family protein
LLPREIKALCGIDVASVCAGQSHILALTYTGGVYSWGEGDHYQALGHGTAGSRVDMVPQRIEALRGVRVRCIAVGAWHSCAVTEAGHMYTWGLGVSGALGNTNYEDKTRPKRVKMLYDKGVFAVGVVAGTEHTLVANADRAVWGFGSLNAIGVGESPALKRLLDRVQESRVQGEDKDWSSMMIFSEGMDDDTFDFLFPGEHCNISVPMRIRSSTYEARVLLR